MKKQTRKRLALVAAVASVAALTGCGGSGQDDPAGFGTGQYGGGTAGCIRIGSANRRIGFVARNAQYDLHNLYAGRIPMAASGPAAGQTFGTMTVTTNTAGGPYTRTTQDGTISFNITSNTKTAYAYQQQMASTTANVNGYLELSPAVVTDILYKNGGMTNYNPYAYPAPTAPAPTTSNVCVSGIAMSIGIQRDYNNNPIGLYGNAVYLYLNRTDHGYIVYP